jgi:hypothetical protein
MMAQSLYGVQSFNQNYTKCKKQMNEIKRKKESINSLHPKRQKI